MLGQKLKKFSKIHSDNIAIQSSFEHYKKFIQGMKQKVERERAEKAIKEHEKRHVAQSKINIMDMDRVEEQLRFNQNIVRGGSNQDFH